MEIFNLYPGSWGSNCYLLMANGRAAVVDPSANAQTIVDALGEKGATLDFILLTHGHFDHIVSVDSLRDMMGAPLYIHEQDAEMLTDARKNAFFTFFRSHRTYRPAEKTLTNGDVLTLGGESIRVIATPGHSKGSVCYLCDDRFLITGDTLFAEGYGRYDLFGGNPKTLFETLDGMRKLPPQLPIYPGHGEPSRLGAALETILY